MGFDDFIENKRDHRGNYVEHRHNDTYSDKRDWHHSSHGPISNLHLSNLLVKIRSNNKLKLLVILASITIMAIVVALTIVLFPLIMKLVELIGQNGLQGLMDSITAFLDKILKSLAK